MTDWTQARIDRAFALLVIAAIRGERCPMTYPHGPLEIGAMERLIALGMIESQVSAKNFRCVHILRGEHAGKCTMRDPSGAPIWKVNGENLRRATDSMKRPVSAPRLLSNP